MQFMNPPQYNGLPMDPYNAQQPFITSQNPYGIGSNAPQMIQNLQGMKPQVDPRIFETPKITMGDNNTRKPMFTVTKDGSNSNSITVDNISDSEKEAKRKKRTGEDLPAKKESGTLPLVRANEPESVKGEIVDSTIYTYQETNGLLHETLGQIDAVNAELVQEFNAVRHNRTMKNKYNVLTALSENIGSMISNRISTIKEINNCISKANDMDYKKYKDIQAAQSTMNDDKYIADLYQAFIQNPQNVAPTYQTPVIDQSVMGSGIIRANVPNSVIGASGGVIDEGYLSYLSNMTPEQNLMRYEGDPNVKQVVVYDASTGAKFFQMMNLATGEAIPNVPVYDQMMMEDTTLDLKTKIAKNINLNESFPIIVINDSITSQY